MVSVVVHTNPGLFNQRETAGWLKAGFKKHGIDAEITADKKKNADVVLIQGPWWAYKEWAGKDNVLFLDRCFFGNPRFDVSIGWLLSDGSRDFKNHSMVASKNTPPFLCPQKERRYCAVVFGDYGRDAAQDVARARETYDSVLFRPHPAQHQVSPAMTIGGELEAIWELADVAVGHSSTVLVEAEINGLHVDSSDPLHVVHHDGDREQWLTDLSWAQWGHEEIKRGEFWEHLR
jgi:hypothetical protein